MPAGDTDERERDMRRLLDRKSNARPVPPRGDPDRCLGPASRETYARWLTPIDEHFVLHRSETLDLSGVDWSVSIQGPTAGAELSVDRIREEFPALSVAHTMECAGNCRAYLEPRVESVAWGFEGASTALWTGAPLESVFDACGIETDDDLWVTAIGADEQAEDGDVFARSIPMAKALEDCILAYEMNGQALPVEHGYPLRLLVPGWYGVNSVKWVEELRVMDEMVSETTQFPDRDGDEYYPRWQQDRYRIVPDGAEADHRPTVPTVDTWDQLESDEVTHPYTFDQNVMSIIGRPTGEETVHPRDDGTVEVVGVAWAGDDGVETVEVSTDGGETWAEARLLGPAYPNAWRLFRYPWRPEPGRHELVSRATDDRGRTQPEAIGAPERGLDAVRDGVFPWNRRGYGANAYRPLSISVEVADR